VKAIKERAKAKFDETIEMAFNLGIDRSIPTRMSVGHFAAARYR